MWSHKKKVKVQQCQCLCVRIFSQVQRNVLVEFLCFWTLAVMTFFYPSTAFFCIPCQTNLSQTSLTVALTPGCERLWTTSNTESEIRRYNRKWTAYWNVTHTLWSLLVQSYTCIGNLWASEGCLVGVYFNTSSLGYLCPRKPQWLFWKETDSRRRCCFLPEIYAMIIMLFNAQLFI